MTERQMHRGELDGDNHEYEPLSAEDPQAREEAFLVRIAVNYLRHECSKYDGYCASLKSKIGRDEAYLRLRERVHQLIKMAYPWLSDECDQQLEAAKDRVATAHY